jgi:hypothetical protein
MVFLGDQEMFVREGITFATWMGDWVNGVDLYTRARQLERKLHQRRLREEFNDTETPHPPLTSNDHDLD